MNQKTIRIMGLCLIFAASGLADSFTRDSGDTNWSNLDQWNYHDGSSYVDAITFPTSNDTILINGGKILTVDTNAYAGTIRLPNGSSDAFLELPAAGALLAVTTFNVGRDGYAGNGTVNQSAGSVVATTLSLQPGGTVESTYTLSGGTIAATNLEIGKASANSVGTATFIQSGGTVTSPAVTIGGYGPGTYEISGGSMTASGALDIITNGQLNVSGTSPVVTATTLDTQPGSELVFSLNSVGVATVQVGGTLNLAHASIRVDGSSYWGGATNMVLMEAGTLASMADADNITITGLVSASVSQVGNSVVLSVVESKTTSVFENITGDGLWNTPGNWSPVGVPSGAVLTRVDNGVTATIATTPPLVDGIIVSSDASLIVQSEISTTELRVDQYGTLKIDLSLLGLSPVAVSSGTTLDPMSQLIIDGTDYEGLGGYFPLITTDHFAGNQSWTNTISFVGMNDREPAAVVQSDGLWLRITAPPAWSDRLCSLVPESTVPVDYSGTTFSATRALEPTGSAWGTTIAEAHVMDTRLTQEMPGSTNQSWDLRVGRGGQIASFRTAALGETVPPSHSSPPNKSPWVDEVWQGVAIDTALNGSVDNSPYFIHQAGVYPYKDPALKQPFYSPMVAASINQEEHSFTTINWGQHAHLQVYTNSYTTDDWHSDLLYITRFRDLGQGVIEVSLGFYNYGPDMPNYFNMPWGGVRRTSMEYGFFSEPGGGWGTSLTNGFGEGKSRKYNLTDGSMAFCATTNGTTPALGLVFGQDSDPLLGNQTADSLMRYGYAGGNPTGNEDDWRNYYVISAIRKYNLSQGRGVWARYYYVLGDDLSDLENRIATRNINDEATLTEFDYTEESTPLVGYRYTGAGANFQIAEDGTSPDFFLYAYPIPDSFPIYEIIEDDETRHLTWNPYETGVIKTYDGTIGGIRLLGFARRTTDVGASAYSYESMAAAMSGAPANYLASGEALSVRTATPIETWRVEYFGFSDDVGDGANTANPDGDVANNFYEYGFGGNPTNPTDIGYLPEAGTLAEGGTNFFEVVYARRIGSADELTYTMESSPNLLSNDWNTAEYTELPITGTLDPDFEAVTNRIDTAGKTNEFIQLKVELL